MQNSFLRNLGYKLFLVFCLLLSLTAGLLAPFWLRVTNVTVEPKRPVLFLKELKGKSLLLINKNELEQEILRNNPTLMKVEIHKSYPQTLFIKFTTATAIAQLESTPYYYLLSVDGKIIGKRETPIKTLPILKSFQKLRYYESKPGQFITNPDLLYALKTSRLASRYGIDFDYLEITKPNQLKIVGKETISYLNTKKQIAKNLEIVQNITVTLKRKGQVPKVINLFFEKAAYTL